MHDRQIQLVEHERFAGETMVIFFMQGIGEGRRSRSVSRRDRIESGAMTDDVSPQRHMRAGDISPQHVQALMPIVEFIVITAFEARAAEAKSLDIVAERRPNDRGRHVSNIRNTIGRADFATQGRPMAQ